MNEFLKILFLLIYCQTTRINFGLIYNQLLLTKSDLQSLYLLVLSTLLYISLQSHLSYVQYQLLIIQLSIILLITIYLDIFKIRKSYWFSHSFESVKKNSKKKKKYNSRVTN